jgi:hypothetical protein
MSADSPVDLKRIDFLQVLPQTVSDPAIDSGVAHKADCAITSIEFKTGRPYRGRAYWLWLLEINHEVMLEGHFFLKAQAYASRAMQPHSALGRLGKQPARGLTTALWDAQRASAADSVSASPPTQ